MMDIQAIIGMARLMRRIDGAKDTWETARAAVLLSILDAKASWESLCEVMAANGVTMTMEQAEARARKIAAMKDPVNMDGEKRTIQVCTFANDECMEDVEMSDEVREGFFSRYDSLGFRDRAATEARMARLKASRIAKTMPFHTLLKIDIENEQAGHPLCDDCKVHHPSEDMARAMEERNECRSLH